MRAPRPDESRDEVRRTIDHEFELIQQAIAMVASGASPRVVVASMRFSDELLDEARAAASRAGVHLTPLWSLDESNRSIAVEPGLG